MTHWCRLVVITLMIGSFETSGHADDAQPWTTGVTAEQKATAQRRLEAGNALFVERKYPEALEQYKQAVTAWDHPAIRFNIVRCLIQLDRPVDASDNLKLALKYGAAPLEDAVYSEALSYQKLLANQIGDLEVSCDQVGVKLTLDGQALPSCPTKETRRVAPGQHQLVGTKDGFLTRTLEVVVIGGKQQQFAVALMPLAKAARVEHRWATWIPWVVFGGGFAIAGIGGMLDYVAYSKMSSYDRQVTHDCVDVGCPPTGPGSVPTGDKTSGERFNNVAVGVMSFGVGTVAAGAVMLYLNRGRTVYPDSKEHLTPTVTPMVGGGAALTIVGRF